METSSSFGTINLGGVLITPRQGTKELETDDDNCRLEGELIGRKLRAYWTDGHLFIDIKNQTRTSIYVSVVEYKDILQLKRQCVESGYNFSIDLGEAPYDPYIVTLHIEVKIKRGDLEEYSQSFYFDMYWIRQNT